MVWGQTYADTRSSIAGPWPGANFLTPELPSAVTEGLVAWYRFSDSANTAFDNTAKLGVGADQTAFDGTVNGASFQSNGGVTDVVSGANPSGAYSLDGVDDFMEFPADSIKLDGSSFTISAWFEFDTVQDELVFLKKGSPNDNETLHIGPLNGEMKFAFFADDLLGPTIATGEKHLWTFSYDASTNERIIYRDGVVFASDTAAGDLQNTDSARFFIGQAEEVTKPRAHPDMSMIDDVRLYNRALSSSEITQIHNNTDPQQ